MAAIPQGSATSPSAQSGGLNAGTGGGQPATPEARLLAMIEQADSANAAKTNETATPAAPEPGPETTEQPTAPQESGETISASEQTPAGEKPEGESQNVLSQSDQKLSDLLSGLDENQRAALSGMLEDVRDGKTGWGELKRGHKLAGQLEELRRQVEQLRSGADPGQRPAREAGPAASEEAPESVSRLDSVEAVNKRERQLRATVRFAEKFLDENPDGGMVNGVEMSRKAVLEEKWRYQDELEHLPRRREQLQQQASWTERQANARAVVTREFPFLDDPEHPDTVRIAARIKQAPWLQNFESPEMAALIWERGEKALAAEKAARNGNGHGKPPLLRPAGKVPLGKPHTQSGGAVPPRANGAPKLAAALDRARKERSVDSFMALADAGLTP